MVRMMACVVKPQSSHLAHLATFEHADSSSFAAVPLAAALRRPLPGFPALSAAPLAALFAVVDACNHPDGPRHFEKGTERRNT